MKRKLNPYYLVELAAKNEMASMREGLFVIRHQMWRMCDAIIAATVAATVAAMIAPCNRCVWRFCKAVTLDVQHLKQTTYALADAYRYYTKAITNTSKPWTRKTT